MPVEALLTHAPTYSSQWMAALVAALPQIIIDLLIYTLIYDVGIVFRGIYWMREVVPNRRSNCW